MRKEYAYHKPSAAGLEKLAQSRQAFSDLADLIDEMVPHTRERSIAHTELQSAARAANAAIIFSDPGAEPER